ncbi:hypothetical protein EJ04DRAFT_577066 [Polyplosphaeria fusca]|uniref:Nephrocystin 3-like N-terminal domain-containing protein n=1 Tax=Polyplosphaeria fusca TaxID=682080 RepID=A0A9P4UZE3_9PLEO|nr:hypothetical protein EJ04DRAFT_577066 [Polyplosphaeria fusca]
MLELMAEIRTLATDSAILQGLIYSSRLEIWKRINDMVSSRNGACKTVFDACKLNIEQHGELKVWISKYDHDEAHLAAQQKAKLETKYRYCSQWFLDSDEFKKWSSGEPGKETLWLHGTTGMGKTTLVAQVIQFHLDRAALLRDRRLAYVYCTGTQPYRSVLLSLLRQAAFDHISCEVFEAVKNAYKSAGGDNQDLKPFNFDKLYNDPLLGLLKYGAKLRILIDALNWCDEPKEVLKRIRDASEKFPVGIQLLVSSTHRVQVDEVLLAVLVDTYLSSVAIETDMKSFIFGEVQDREQHEKLLKGEYPDVENRLIEILCRRVGGMFRWVELQLSLFLNSEQVRSKSVIDDYLKDLDVKSVAGEKDLTEAYDAIFHRNTAERDKERKRVTLISTS